MSMFLGRLIKARPDLVNSVVYFSPNKKTNLPCIIRGDGTLSPSCDASLRFDSAKKLADAWKSKKFSSPGVSIGNRVKPSLFMFNKDVFFEKGRVNLLSNL